MTKKMTKKDCLLNSVLNIAPIGFWEWSLLRLSNLITHSKKQINETVIPHSMRNLIKGISKFHEMLKQVQHDGIICFFPPHSFSF